MILLSILFVIIYLNTVALFIYISSKALRVFNVNKYKNILSLLDHFLKLSYDWIYADQILGYTSSGSTTIPQDEMETIERNFIKLAFDMMGPTNRKIFSDFYGTREILINNMLLYIRDQIARDEISKVISNKQKEISIT